LGFALFAAVLVSWSLVVPLLEGPDEADHAIRAAALVRGQLLSEHDRPADVVFLGGHAIGTFVKVPEAYRLSGGSYCFSLHPRLSAQCAPEFRGGQRLVRVITNEYRAPPFYYAVIGLPTLVWPAAMGVYAMRLLNALACAAFLASALLSLFELGKPLAPMGLLVAATPEALYLGGVLHPSGLEFAAAMSLWAALLVMVRRPTDPSGRLVTRAGVALVVLLLTRGTGPLFAFLALVIVLSLGSREQLARLVARVDVRRWLLAALGALVLAGAWVLYISAGWPDQRAGGSGFLSAAGETGSFMRQAVGTFNTHSSGLFHASDVPLPVVVYACWAVVTVALLILAFATAGRRDAIVLLALIVVTVTLPVLIEGLNFPPTGVAWVGKDGLPMLGALPLVAATIARTPARSRRRKGPRLFALGGVVLFLLVAAQIVAFGATLRLWAVGSAGALNPFGYLFDPVWTPPVPGVVLLGLFTGGLAGLAVVVARALRAAAEQPGPDTAVEPTVRADATTPATR